MRQMGIPLAIAGYPAQVKWPAPAPGEHTEAVLKDLGYSAGRVRGLKQEGVI
jgi:crotonobetainyl-CoA:carnitine CoA-transferase CaiB-like acyl-CoA transferase